MITLAKVDGPLMSLGARGKIGDAMVFFPWKGVNAVRRWLKPTQPNSTLQGYVRAAMSAIGKVISKIQSVSGGDAVDSALYALSTDKAPSGINWNAFFAQGFLNLLQSGGAFQTASLAAYVAAYSSLGSLVLTAFKTNATALGLVDFAFDYGYTANIEAGCQLYFGALGAFANELAASAPYNTNPNSWTDSDVNSFKTDFVAV
ncbi:MAG: hypothetical protein PHN44_06530 [Candidatus Marinimicrobia bacterium]|nr:hypothetical protein [Candidatus Neomarinimicrobiota bacterium]